MAVIILVLVQRSLLVVWEIFIGFVPLVLLVLFGITLVLMESKVA